MSIQFNCADSVICGTLYTRKLIIDTLSCEKLWLTIETKIFSLLEFICQMYFQI